MKQKIKLMTKDPTSYSLLISNLLVIVLSIYGNLSISAIIYLFYFQSLIIGFFILLKILKYDGPIEDFDDLDSKYEHKKLGLAFYFLFQFGLFHFVYLLFLGFPPVEIFIVLSIYLFVFFINHLFSYIYHSKKKEILNIRILELMIIKRIFPIHAFIIFGSIFVALLYFVLSKLNIDENIQNIIINYIGVTFFLVLKTIGDLNSHINQHTQNR